MTNNLLSILFKSADLNDNNVRSLEHFQKKWGLRPYDAILQCKIFTEGRLADLIAERYGLERLASINIEQVDKTALQQINYQSARLLSCVAICFEGDAKGTKIAIADPSNQDLIDFLSKQFSRKPYRLVVSTKSEIDEALSNVYDAEALFFLG